MLEANTHSNSYSLSCICCREAILQEASPMLQPPRTSEGLNELPLHAACLAADTSCPACTMTDSAKHWSCSCGRQKLRQPWTQKHPSLLQLMGQHWRQTQLSLAWRWTLLPGTPCAGFQNCCHKAPLGCSSRLSGDTTQGAIIPRPVPLPWKASLGSKLLEGCQWHWCQHFKAYIGGPLSVLPCNGNCQALPR